MEKFGFVYTNNMGELICNYIYQLRANIVFELTVVGVEKDDGTMADEIDEMETEFNTFEQLDDYYFNRRSQCVLIFKEYPSISEAMQIIGEKINVPGW